MKKNIILFWKNKKYIKINSNDKKVGAATFCLKNIYFILKKFFFNIYFLKNCYREFDSYLKKKNKFSKHKQFQVICFPVPVNFLNIYQESLYFFNNLKFKKDNWKSPMLGAKGIGYEVIKDNIEISQITLFSHFANKKLFKPILEITYGLERIKKINNKNFIKEKFFSINNIFFVFKIKKILFFYKICFFHILKKNYFFSYYIFIKLVNFFNLIDECYFINNFNRIKIISLIKSLSEKIIKKIC